MVAPSVCCAVAFWRISLSASIFLVLSVKDCIVTMSDHITKSYQEESGTSMRPYHSVWLSHWAHSGCKSANGACNNLSTSSESGEENSQTKKRPLLDGAMQATLNGKHAIGSGEVAGETADYPNNESLTGRSKKRRKERPRLVKVEL
ncbi:hypothetical protein SDJN03_30019, partial [Cucurbita argyrosperma subsp. sororia]